ncbi:MAG: HupE/UreJ family protein [Sandaracinaceae bacterium]|nr:HupE/UreJ family protein [Sandaracinaceae bacterium]
MTRAALPLTLICALLLPGSARAHSLMFGVLRVVEDADGAALTLRAGGEEGRVPDLTLHVSGACELEAPPTREITGALLVVRGRARCLDGARVEVEGLGAAGLRVAVQVVRLDGTEEAVAFLEPGQPAVTITPAAPTPPVFGRYARLGVDHLAFGLDHLLFLLALTLVVFDPRVARARPLRALGLTVTGFTLGHALTLSLAVLAGLTLPSAPVELCIALSIVFLAVEVIRAPTTLVFRAPWLVAAAFGLIHGLGFAGALTEMGLPAGDAPLALVAFHVGLEVAQLAFVGLAVGALWAARRLAPHRRWLAYAIGAVATVWVGLRLDAMLA